MVHFLHLVDDQAEVNGTTLASWNTTEKSKEHHKLQI